MVGRVKRLVATGVLSLAMLIGTAEAHNKKRAEQVLKYQSCGVPASLVGFIRNDDPFDDFHLGESLELYLNEPIHGHYEKAVKNVDKSLDATLLFYYDMPVSYIRTLKDIMPKLDAATITAFSICGVKPNYVRQLTENDPKISGEDIINVFAHHVPVKYTRAIRASSPQFTGDDIVFLFEEHVPADYMKNVIAILQSKQDAVSYVNAFRKQVPLSYIRELADEYGLERTTDLFLQGVPADYAKVVAGKLSSEQVSTLFSNNIPSKDVVSLLSNDILLHQVFDNQLHKEEWRKVDNEWKFTSGIEQTIIKLSKGNVSSDYLAQSLTIYSEINIDEILKLSKEQVEISYLRTGKECALTLDDILTLHHGSVPADFILALKDVRNTGTDEYPSYSSMFNGKDIQILYEEKIPLDVISQWKQIGAFSGDAIALLHEHHVPREYVKTVMDNLNPKTVMDNLNLNNMFFNFTLSASYLVDTFEANVPALYVTSIKKMEGKLAEEKWDALVGDNVYCHNFTGADIATLYKSNVSLKDVRAMRDVYWFLSGEDIVDLKKAHVPLSYLKPITDQMVENFVGTLSPQDIIALYQKGVPSEKVRNALFSSASRKDVLDYLNELPKEIKPETVPNDWRLR